MKAGVITLVILLSSFLAYGQKNQSKIRIYKARINCFDNNKLIKGTFYDYNDSTIILIRANSKHELKKTQPSIKKIPVHAIKRMKLRRNGQVGTSALIGAAAGATFGAAIGFVDGDDEPGWFSLTAEEKAATLAIPLLVIGGVVGAVAGSSSHKINLYGDLSNIYKYQYQLEKCSIANKLKIE